VSRHTARPAQPIYGAPRTPIGAKVLAALLVMVLLVAGTLGFGRIGDDANVAMGLTAVWFGVVFVGGSLVSLRRPALRWWMVGGYAVVAIVAGIVLILPTLNDKEVNEKVATGAPAGQPAPDRQERGGASKPAGNVQLFSGSFRSVAHSGTGTAAVVELAEGGRVVTLTDFETDSGPDLRLYLSTGDPASGDLGDFKDLGALKGNKGNQQYDLPRGLDLGRYGTVVVWCRAFSVPFTSAKLEKS
jgi:Electron transfer DM13